MAVDVLGSGVDVPSRKLAGLGKGVCDPPWFKRRNERRRRASGVSNRRVRGLVGKTPNTLHRSLAMELRRQRASPSGCRWSTPALPYREGTTDTGRVATRSACRKTGNRTTHGASHRAPLPQWGDELEHHGQRALVRMRNYTHRLSSRKREALSGTHCDSTTPSQWLPALRSATAGMIRRCENGGWSGIQFVGRPKNFPSNVNRLANKDGG